MKMIKHICCVAALVLFIVLSCSSKDVQASKRKTYPSVDTKTDIFKYLTEPPEIIYSTLGSENKLGGTCYSITGTVKGVYKSTKKALSGLGKKSEAKNLEEDQKMKLIIVKTTKGDIIISDVYSYYLNELSAYYDGDSAGLDKYLTDNGFSKKKYKEYPKKGEKVTVLATYSGYSNLFDLPIFYYGINPGVVYISGGTDKNVNTNSQEKVDIKYGNIKMKVLKSWNNVVEENIFLYLYPESGMFLMFSYNLDSSGFNQYAADSVAEKLGQLDMFSNYKITASKKNEYKEKAIDTYYIYTFETYVNSEKCKGKLTLFEYDDYLYLLTYICPESSKESKRLFNEYSKIIKSIKPQKKSDSKKTNDNKTEKSNVDYSTEEDFEAALNNGKDVVGKTVSFVTDDYHPDSAFGYNYWAGEHLNFCSVYDPGFKNNVTVTVRVVEVRNVFGSWIIYYEKI